MTVVTCVVTVVVDTSALLDAAILHPNFGALTFLVSSPFDLHPSNSFNDLYRGRVFASDFKYPLVERSNRFNLHPLDIFGNKVNVIKVRDKEFVCKIY